MIELLTVYRAYPSSEHAQALLDLLDSNKIEYVVEKTAPFFDATFANNHLKEDIVVKLKPSDFEKVDKLLEQIAIDAFDTIDKDYYLFGFTDEELIDIVVNPYEWSPFDYQLAQKILKDHGKEIPKEIAQAIKKSNIEGLSTKEVSPIAWIWAGYILSALGGLLGFFIGWHLVSYSKVLPNGQKIKVYDHNTQSHGARIMIIGGIGIIIWVVIRVSFVL